MSPVVLMILGKRTRISNDPSTVHNEAESSSTNTSSDVITESLEAHRCTTRGEHLENALMKSRVILTHFYFFLVSLFSRFIIAIIIARQFYITEIKNTILIYFTSTFACTYYYIRFYVKKNHKLSLPSVLGIFFYFSILSCNLNFDSTMKIISWNVQGLKSVATRNHLSDLIRTQNPDIIFLCETKTCQDKSKPVISHYQYPNQAFIEPVGL